MQRVKKGSVPPEEDKEGICNLMMMEIGLFVCVCVCPKQ